MSRQINRATGVAILGLLLGALFAVGGYYSINGLRGAPDLWGYKRGLALGVPLATIGGLHLLSALAVLFTRKAWAIVGCMISALLTVVFYLAFEASTIGLFGANVVSVLAYGLPIYMILEGWKAIRDEDLAGGLPQQNAFGGEL